MIAYVVLESDGTLSVISTDLVGDESALRTLIVGPENDG